MVSNHKIDPLFGVVIIVFLLSAFILIREFNSIRENDLKQYSVSMDNIVREKNNKIRQLYNDLLVQQRTIQDLKNTLSDTRNSLDALSNKLSQQAPGATAPVSIVPATK
jgi:hypothetical protein